MGVKGRRGEIRFHGFKLFLSQCCFPLLQQLISLVSGLSPSPASSPRFPAAQQGLSHLGKSFSGGQGREASSLLLLVLGQALPCVAPCILLSFQVAVPHCGFLLLFKPPLAQMRPGCMFTLAALNRGQCDTSGTSHSPCLSSFFLQGRRLFAAPLFPSLSSTEMMPQQRHLFKDSSPSIQIPYRLHLNRSSWWHMGCPPSRG